MKNEFWYVIVNPQAAHGRAGRLWPLFQERLQKEGLILEVAITQSPGDGERLAREGIAKGYSRIIGVGGDGTINEILNGLFDDNNRAQAELAILAIGTGGDFLRSLGNPKGIDAFLEVLKREDKRLIDVGLMEFSDTHGRPAKRYFLNVADAGLGGETAARVNRQSKRLGGRLSFLLGSIQAILGYRNKWMKCTLDGRTIVSGVVNSIMVANGRFFGGGMEIAPHARLDDGLLDVIVLGNFSKIELLWHLPKIYHGKHLEVRGVFAYRGTTVQIEGREKILLDCDGEQPGEVPVRFKVLPAALCFWV